MLSSMFGIVWFPCESPLSVFIELMSAIESCKKVVCLKKYFPNQQKKEHRRPHAAAPANNDWLDFPVE